MTAYMVLARSIDIQIIKTEELIRIIQRYVASERKHKATLAAKRRKYIGISMENEQYILKK